MKVSKSSLVLTAAFTGLLGGTMARVNAMTPTSTGSTVTSSHAAAGIAGAVVHDDDKDKHGCKGKNSCKGKGGCATDGSKK